MEELLPLLILILIVRGIFGSRKRKEKYIQERSNMNKMPSENERSVDANSLRGLIYELTKDVNPQNQNIDRKEKYISRDQAQKANQRINEYGESQKEINRSIEQSSYQDSQIKQLEANEDRVVYDLSKVQRKKDLKKKRKKKNSLEFSKNPLVQGIIFSEIIGPPKSKR